ASSRAASSVRLRPPGKPRASGAKYFLMRPNSSMFLGKRGQHAVQEAYIVVGEEMLGKARIFVDDDFGFTVLVEQQLEYGTLQERNQQGAHASTRPAAGKVFVDFG